MDTATKAPPGEGDVEITEFEMFEVESVKGVKAGANGFPHLLMKGLADGGEATSAEPAEPTGRPSWHAPAAALARMGAKISDVDPAILFKAVNAAGEVDEGPDIDGGKQAIALIAKLIQYEAAELEAGCLDETCDIGLLLEAASALKCWLSMERSNLMADSDADAMKGCGCCGLCTGPGDGCCAMCTPGMGKAAVVGKAADGGGGDAAAELIANHKELWALALAGETVTKDSRTFTAAERRKHAAEGNALPDGSYPIPDKDALRRAAILARSGHGDVKAAKRLIARRARELGVPNPLDTDDKASSGASKATAEAVVAEEATAVDTEAQEITDGLQKAIDEAVAKALGSSQERFTALEDELAKAKADLRTALDRPIHGGPVLSAASVRTAQKADGIDHAAEAARLDGLAKTVSDPATAEHYSQLAARERAKIPAS